MTEVQSQSLFRYLCHVGYYDRPEGEDAVGKVVACTRYGLVGGLCIATYKTFVHEGFETIPKVANLYAYYMIPMAAMGATFSLVTYAATQARGVDSPLNHALGVAAAALIGYKWTGNGSVSFHWGLYGALLAAAAKHSRLMDYDLACRLPKDMPMLGLSFMPGRYRDDPRPWKH